MATSLAKKPLIITAFVILTVILIGLIYVAVTDKQTVKELPYERF